MSMFEILIGMIFGMVIAYYSHDYWCDWLKYRKGKNAGMQKKKDKR